MTEDTRPPEDRLLALAVEWETAADITAARALYGDGCGTAVTTSLRACASSLRAALAASRPAPAEPPNLDADGDPIRPDVHSEDWYDGYLEGQRDALPAEPPVVDLRAIEAAARRFDSEYAAYQADDDDPSPDGWMDAATELRAALSVGPAAPRDSQP